MCLRTVFPLANSLISSVKKIFLKAPARVHLFKQMHPELPLPPEPIITRWGTWIKAAEYYADNFFEIVEIIRALEDESEAIKSAKEIVENADLISELTAIKSNYAFLAKTITKLEASKSLLKESLALVADAKQKIESAPHEKIRQKILAVFEKNIGLKALSSIDNSEERKKYK